MLFDSVNFYLSSYSGGSVSSTSTLLTIPNASGNSGFFDYYVSDGTNSRAGTVMSVWNSSTTNFTDYSTPDIGGPTTGITFQTITNGTIVSLQAVVTSGTWTVKVGSRVIF
jgi:hypothetical protein